MKLFFICIALCLVSCGVKYDFKNARQLEKEGAYLEAVKVYENIQIEYKDNAPEALFSSGEIYRKYLHFYPEAVSQYKLIYELYPNSGEWVRKAKRAVINCPDYFPMHDGDKWAEVDSQTGGVNMREERSCVFEEDKSTGKTLIKMVRKIYAGTKLVDAISGSTYYEKDNFEVREYENYKRKIFKVILKFPYEEGQTWTSQEGGRTVYFKIIDTKAACNVKAGVIRDCIKVSQSYKDIDAVKYTYYAPFIGKVLTTAKSPESDQETRNTELKSYKISEE